VPEPTLTGTAADCPAMVFAGYYVDTYLQNLLRLFYRDRPLDRFPGCRHLHYVADIRSAAAVDTPGSLRIDLWSQWNPSRTGSAPVISIRRGDMGSSRIAIADRHQFPSSYSPSGSENFTRVWTGSVAIWCTSRVPAEASLLSLQTADYLQGMAKPIADQLGIQRLEVRSVSAVKPLREHPAFLASAVVIEYGFFLTWGVHPSAPRLNRIELQT